MVFPLFFSHQYIDFFPVLVVYCSGARKGREAAFPPKICNGRTGSEVCIR